MLSTALTAPSGRNVVRDSRPVRIAERVTADLADVGHAVDPFHGGGVAGTPYQINVGVIQSTVRRIGDVAAADVPHNIVSPLVGL
jgi:hypothetical protein